MKLDVTPCGRRSTTTRVTTGSPLRTNIRQRRPPPRCDGDVSRITNVERLTTPPSIVSSESIGSMGGESLDIQVRRRGSRIRSPPPHGPVDTRRLAPSRYAASPLSRERAMIVTNRRPRGIGQKHCGPAYCLNSLGFEMLDTGRVIALWLWREVAHGR